MAVLSGGAARRESATIDEVAHTAAGVTYLQKLDMRMNEEHPPLAKVLAALPLVLRGVHVDYSHLSWTFSERIFRQYLGEWVFGNWFLMRWNDPRSTLGLARVPMLLLSLSLGAVLFVCGSKLGGEWGGLLCLTAYVTMPAFLAFGPLVLTDVAITLFWVLTVWQLPELWRNPSRATVLKFAAVFAGALLSKFSSGLLIVAFLAFAVSTRLWPLPEQPTVKAEVRRWRRQGWRNLVKGTAWALFFVYLVYLLLSWRQPTDSFNVIPHLPTSPLLRRALMPAWVFLRGLSGFVLSAGTRPTYILGRAYPRGVWFYFPTLFVLKSQLAFLWLLLLAAGVRLLVKWRLPQQAAIAADMALRWRSLWVSLCVFVAACLLSRLNISIRHFSVALALTALFLAPLPRLLRALGDRSPGLARLAGWATIVLVMTLIGTAVQSYPNYLPFLNSLAMGRPGYALVNDSNLDWNHALPTVKSFMEERGIDRVLLDEYGFSEPEAYIPQAESWDCQQPHPSDAGRLAVVSANYMADSANCIWLMHYPHQALAGGSMYAFILPPVIPAAGQPGGPPLPGNYRYFGGLPFDMRSVFTECIRDPNRLEPTMRRMMENSPKNKKQ